MTPSMGGNYKSGRREWAATIETITYYKKVHCCVCQRCRSFTPWSCGCRRRGGRDRRGSDGRHGSGCWGFFQVASSSSSSSPSLRSSASSQHRPLKTLTRTRIQRTSSHRKQPRLTDASCAERDTRLPDRNVAHWWRSGNPWAQRRTYVPSRGCWERGRSSASVFWGQSWYSGWIRERRKERVSVSCGLHRTVWSQDSGENRERGERGNRTRSEHIQRRTNWQLFFIFTNLNISCSKDNWSLRRIECLTRFGKKIIKASRLWTKRVDSWWWAESNDLKR